MAVRRGRRRNSQDPREEMCGWTGRRDPALGGAVAAHRVEHDAEAGQCWEGEGEEEQDG